MKRHCGRGNSQRGASLVTALFLIVVLAGLGSFAVRLTAVQQQTVGTGLRAAQAMLAARSGIAWAAHQALSAGSCSTQTLTLTEAGVAGFSVRVSCTQSAHTEAGSALNVYSIEALAESGTYGGADYVSRRLHAKITDAI